MTMTAQEILEARITYLAYAPEITTIIDARKMIVDGAVGMVEMALERINEGELVELDEERKAAMVSNLLVVLCGNHDAQPIVNTGSLYQTWLKLKKADPPSTLNKVIRCTRLMAEDDFVQSMGKSNILLTECVKQRKKDGKYVIRNH